jgi:hypothetical protein
MFSETLKSFYSKDVASVCIFLMDNLYVNFNEGELALANQRRMSCLYFLTANLHFKCPFPGHQELPVTLLGDLVLRFLHISSDTLL